MNLLLIHKGQGSGSRESASTLFCVFDVTILTVTDFFARSSHVGRPLALVTDSSELDWKWGQFVCSCVPKNGDYCYLIDKVHFKRLSLLECERQDSTCHWSIFAKAGKKVPPFNFSFAMCSLDRHRLLCKIQPCCLVTIGEYWDCSVSFKSSGTSSSSSLAARPTCLSLALN